MTVLGLAHLTALDLPPTELVKEAGRAGFRSVGLRLHPAMAGGAAYPARIGSCAYRELHAVLAGEGVRLHEVEFIPLVPEIDVPSLAGVLETGARLGAAAVTVSGDDPDAARLGASFAALCDLAAEFGLRADLEFMRWRAVGTLAQALAVLRQADKPNGAILVDALHLNRSGGQPGDLRDVPACFLRAAQLCDAAPAMPAPEAVIAEAREGRLLPGEGGLPLPALLAALPADVALSVETPVRGLDAKARIAAAYAATRRLLQGLPRHGAANGPCARGAPP